MARLSVTELEARRDRYVEAETKVLLGQEYSIGSRRMTRADLADIRDTIKSIDDQIAYLTNGAGARVRGLSLG